MPSCQKAFPQTFIQQNFLLMCTFFSQSICFSDKRLTDMRRFKFCQGFGKSASEMKFTRLYICYFLLITLRSRNQRNSIVFKMNNTTCFNISTAVLLSQFNSTTLQNFNCTNGSATDNPKSTWNTFDLYSSTAKIVAYSTVYSILSIIALAGSMTIYMYE